MKNNPLLLAKNDRGVTLVEVLVAFVVLLLIFIGLLQAAMLGIDHNLRNNLREEALQIAEQRMNGRLVGDDGNTYDGLTVIPFKDLAAMASAWTQPIYVSRSFRNLSKPYAVSLQITNLNANTIQIEVAVGWDHKKETPQKAPTNTEYQHRISTLRRG